MVYLKLNKDRSEILKSIEIPFKIINEVVYVNYEDVQKKDNAKSIISQLTNNQLSFNDFVFSNQYESLERVFSLDFQSTIRRT